MSKVNRFTRSIVMALLCMGFTAPVWAIPFTFSYDLGTEVVSGNLIGDLQGDNDTVLVSSIAMNGALATPFVGQWLRPGGWVDWQTFSRAGPAIVSISGSRMNILACDVDDCAPGFTGLGIYADITDFILGFRGIANDPNVPFDPANWSLVAASSVPEPSIVVLLSAGLIGVGFTRRRRRVN